MKYELQTPINVGGETRKELTLRRPRAIDFEILDEIEGLNRRKVRLIANCTGLAPEEASQLDGYDFMVLGEIVTGFFSRSPSESQSRS